MTAAAKEVTKKALALPEKERLKLATTLLQSVPDDSETLSQKEWNEAWETELKKRIEEVESGKVKCIPYAEVRRRLNRILRKT